jgi:hypothetical protein
MVASYVKSRKEISCITAHRTKTVLRNLTIRAVKMQISSPLKYYISKAAKEKPTHPYVQTI